MSTIEHAMSPDPERMDMAQPQTDSNPTSADFAESNFNEENSTQPDTDLKVQPHRRGGGEDTPDQPARPEHAETEKAGTSPRPRRGLTSPLPNMQVLTIDDALGVQTEMEKARDKYLDLIESLKTGRYLTDHIQGVERHSGNGEPRAVLFHGDYKVIIMASMIVQLPKDLRGQEPSDVYHYLLSKRLGSEIDYVVKGVDSNTGLAVGSRMEAMATKRRHYYLNPTREGTYRMHEGLCCEARVMSVIPDGIFVELFGIDIYIPLRELSYVRLADAMGYYSPGDRVLVKITRLNRDDPENIRVSASVKQVAANPVDKAIEKIETGGSYAGSVSMVDGTGIFVQLDMGVDCRCRYPYRARPPKGARVIVKVAGIDHERKLVWGNITYVTIPK